MKGKGCSWSRAQLGCDLRIYGWKSEDEHAIAQQSADEIRLAVLAVVPQAIIEIRDLDDGIRIHVRVHADELAVFDRGPIHREAIIRANHAAGRALDSCSWTTVQTLT